MAAPYPDMAAVEQALLARLAADERLTQWAALCISLPAITQDSWAKLFTRFPAVGTYCARATYSAAHQGNATAETAPMAIICAGANYRLPSAARAGGPEQPGALQVVEACRRAVDGWGPEANLRSIRPTGWTLAWANNQTAVCALTVEVELIRPRVPTDGELKAYGSIQE